MLRCSLKLTHDATIALAQDSKLLASVELEKIDNNARWTAADNLSSVERVLTEFGFCPDDVGRWLVDGWVADEPLRIVASDGRVLSLTVAPYREEGPDDDILVPTQGQGLRIGGRDHSYSSYRHVAGHLMGSWATSPFSTSNKETYVLVWDGGVDPRLYRVNPFNRSVQNLGPLFHLHGHAYSFATKYFGPFKNIWRTPDGEDTTPGKMMAYIALGRPRTDLTTAIRETYQSSHQWPRGDLWQDFLRNHDGNGFCRNATNLFEAIREVDIIQSAPEEDVLLAVHNFLEELLQEGLRRVLQRSGARLPVELCFAGGCALNIKWNRALRAMTEISDLFVPPFPNDSGSAIGAIACDLFCSEGLPVEWNAFLGPNLQQGSLSHADYATETCDLPSLARLLSSTGEPVVFLNGRAELGPRALGRRSILADPRSHSIKDVLNGIKGREAFRPVAPVCLESRSSEIFSPGGQDPYMLFEHHVRPHWKDKIPGVVHLDGSARLQTVTSTADPTLHSLLSHFDALTGVPVLCNTSANFEGKGFFPDVESALAWGGARYVWANGQLFARKPNQGPDQ
jgi:carbamoyltransferase